MDQRGETRPDDEVGPAAARRMADLGVDVDEAAVNRLARRQRVLHGLIAGVIRIVGLPPEGVAAKGEMSHEVGVEIGKAP